MTEVDRLRKALRALVETARPAFARTPFRQALDDAKILLAEKRAGPPVKPEPKLAVDSSPAAGLRINAYLHCAQCMTEYKAGFNADGPIPSILSPRDYAHTQTGLTADGLQVWCNRHECNVADFSIRHVPE